MSPAAAGIVLAAGRSTRMGTLKQLLPVGDAPAVVRAARAFSDVGVRPLVVLGFAAGSVVSVLREASIDFVVNHEFDDGMFTSVQKGVSSVPLDVDWVGVLPSDCCLVRGETIGRLARAMTEASCDLVYPTLDGRRGHPPLLGEGVREAALAAPPRSNLRRILTQVEGTDVEVEDRGVSLDMDERAQYERVVELARWEGVPTAGECVSLLECKGVPGMVRRHCAAVAGVARVLGQALQPEGACLHLALLHAAALLHDIARAAPRHAVAGARLLTECGYPRVASLVEHHMDLPEPVPGLPGERELLYLADKLVDGDRVVSLAERRATMLARFAENAAATAATQERLRRADCVAAAVERLSGHTLECLLAPVKRTR